VAKLAQEDATFAILILESQNRLTVMSQEELQNQ
jgi:hypothetical protein